MATCSPPNTEQTLDLYSTASDCTKLDDSLIIQRICGWNWRLWAIHMNNDWPWNPWTGCQGQFMTVQGAHVNLNQQVGTQCGQHRLEKEFWDLESWGCITETNLVSYPIYFNNHGNLIYSNLKSRIKIGSFCITASVECVSPLIWQDIALSHSKLTVILLYY